MTNESLNRTWFIDIDGTIVKHASNEQLDDAIEEMGDYSYLTEEPLKKSVDFLNNIPSSDTIILTTARDKRHKDHTIKTVSYTHLRAHET